MIVSLRGTNGAGKSTIVRAIMAEYSVEKLYREHRKKPIGYHLDGGRIYIPGHYEIANGGIDTLRHLDEAYDLIRAAWRAGRNVIYEGKNLQDGSTRIQEFPQFDVRVVVVNTPLTECVASVRNRGHGIAEKTIERLHEKVLRDADRLTKIGYFVTITDRAGALELCKSLLHKAV